MLNRVADDVEVARPVALLRPLLTISFFDHVLSSGSLQAATHPRHDHLVVQVAQHGLARDGIVQVGSLLQWLVTRLSENVIADSDHVQVFASGVTGRRLDRLGLRDDRLLTASGSRLRIEIVSVLSACTTLIVCKR